MSNFVEPKANGSAFHCPNCGSYSDQHWRNLSVSKYNGHTTYMDFDVGCCRHCEDITIWKNGKMIFPLTGNAPLPNPDMIDDIKQDYLEARDIVSRSPRSACVLLRLCIEKICDEKNAKGKDLSEKIGKLVEQGLNAEISKALDTIRVIGGQAVHPLEMDLRDDVGTATTLFKLVNYISGWAHTEKKIIGSIFDSIPDGKKEAIKKRDTKSGI